MFKYLVPAIVGLAITIPTGLVAQSFLLKKVIIIPVRAIDANTFEVVENHGAGGTQLWCAAGKFTREYLGQRGGDLGVLQPRALSAAFPGRKSVIFSTQPVPNPVKSYSQTVRVEGKTFSQAHAYALCKSIYEYIVKIYVIES